MVQVDNGNPDRWSLRSTITWAEIGISAFFGVMGILAWYGLCPFEGRDVYSQVAAVLLLCVAVVPVSWRVEVTIDRRERTITAGYGLFVSLFHHSTNLVPKSVRLERSADFNGDGINYAIRHEILLPMGNGAPVYVSHIPDAMKAHALATELAMFLDVPLDDQTELIRVREHWLCFDPWFAARPMQARYVKIGPDGNWQRAYEKPKDWQVCGGQDRFS